jgi:hypothetical protein
VVGSNVFAQASEVVVVTDDVIAARLYLRDSPASDLDAASSAACATALHVHGKATSPALSIG